MNLIKRTLLWTSVVVCIMSTGCRFIVNRYAFYPDRSNPITAEQLPAGVTEVFVPTPDGERLQGYWLARPQSRWVLIYFHGNSGHIGQRLPELTALAGMDINVLGVSYRGYGRSTGRPSEAGIYTDGRAALTHVTGELGFETGHVILLGRSIGSTVAVEIGRDTQVGGCILVSPLTSGRSMARRGRIGPLIVFVGRPFDNLSKIDALQTPLLIIHGRTDEIVPFAMGRELFERAPDPKWFVPLEGAGHNDIGIAGTPAYRDAVSRFITALKNTAAPPGQGRP